MHAAMMQKVVLVLACTHSKIDRRQQSGRKYLNWPMFKGDEFSFLGLGGPIICD